MLLEHAKTKWPIAEDVLHSPNVTAWQQALMNNLHSSDGFRVLSLDGTMKIAMGLRRYETRIPRPQGGIVDGGVDDNTCVLTICTLEGGLLNLAVVPNDSRPCHVVAALESAIRPDQRCGVRWLVVATAALRSAVLNSFPRLQGIALDTCHRPIKYESVASNRKSPGSQMLRRLVSKFNVGCPWMHRLISSFPSTVMSRVTWMTRSSTFTKTYANVHSLARNWTWPSPT